MALSNVLDGCFNFTNIAGVRLLSRFHLWKVIEENIVRFSIQPLHLIFWSGFSQRTDLRKFHASVICLFEGIVVLINESGSCKTTFINKPIYEFSVRKFLVVKSTFGVKERSNSSYDATKLIESISFRSQFGFKPGFFGYRIGTIGNSNLTLHSEPGDRGGAQCAKCRDKAGPCGLVAIGPELEAPVCLAHIHFIGPRRVAAGRDSHVAQRPATTSQNCGTEYAASDDPAPSDLLFKHPPTLPLRHFTRKLRASCVHNLARAA